MADGGRSDPWPTMTLLGVLCGLAIGAVLVMLFRREDRSGLGLGSGSNDLLDELDAPARPTRLPLGLPPGGMPTARPVPIARTVPLGTGRPTFLMQAQGPRDWTVWVRVNGPPGATATFMIGREAGNAIEINAGQFQQMQIPRGETLYARANTSNVQVSVSGGQG